MDSAESRIAELERENAALRSTLAEPVKYINVDLETEISRLKAIVDQVDHVLTMDWIVPKAGDYRTALHELMRFAVDVERYHDEWSPVMEGWHE